MAGEFEKANQAKAKKEFIDFICQRNGWQPKQVEQFIDILETSRIAGKIDFTKVMMCIKASEKEDQITFSNICNYAYNYDVSKDTARKMHYQANSFVLMHKIVWEGTIS